MAWAGAARASWVGMGWSLEGDYISRDQHGTPNYYNDDTFSLQVNGVGGLLLPIADADGNALTVDYKLADDNFWRVRRYIITDTVNKKDDTYWVAWDKDGSQYRFDDRARYPAIPGNQCANLFRQTWQWSLSKERNAFGKELTYSYYLKSENRSPKTGCSALTDLAVYPDSITYANSRYRVRFERSATLRNDYSTAWDSTSSTMLYKRSKLDKIWIEHDSDGNGSFDVIIRKYQLGYAERSQQVFRNRTWSGTGKALTLTSIQEYGLGGTGTPLPATTFTYGDDMHLTAADNGYGGRVEFVYENPPWNELVTDTDPVKDWGVDYYKGRDTQLDFGSAAAVYNLGQTYLITMSLQTNGTQFELGVEYAPATRLLATDVVTTILPSGRRLITGTVQLPVSASQAQFIYKCISHNCIPWHGIVRPLVTRYRVQQKKLYDGISGTPQVFSYHYDGPASNDSFHSEAVANTPTKTQRYNPALSEYRGNSTVAVSGPDGRIDLNLFYQDDERKGSANTTLVLGQALTNSFDSPGYQPLALLPNPPRPGQNRQRCAWRAIRCSR